MKSIFPKQVLFFGALAAGIFLERMLVAFFGARFPVPPLTLFAAAAWMPVLPLSRRLWLAGGVGFVMDTLGALPFGTWLVLMLSAALLAEFFLRLVSARESAIAHIGVSSALAASMLLLSSLAQASVARLSILLP